MDFFKSVFSDTQPNSPISPNPNSPNAWSFNSLLQTLTHDLEEFTSGLKKETLSIRDAAKRAVKEFPDAFDKGASVAQHSLESVGQAVDDLGNIILLGKEVLLSIDNQTNQKYEKDENLTRFSTGGGKFYSRFETQVRAIQVDLSTYCEDPEDFEEFGRWKGGVLLGKREEEIENLLGENGVVASFYRKLVPGTVGEEMFWCRYFYRVHKLKQVEDARAELVKRALGGEEEDLSWDLDDEEESVSSSKGNEGGGECSRGGEDKSSDSCDLVEKVDSCGKDSDFSVVSSQRSIPEEEDIGWDEIEDVSSIDERKVRDGYSPSKGGLRKRLSSADEEEDLSWDIEDDDDGHVKP